MNKLALATMLAASPAYGVGGPMILPSHGMLPVFIDGRAETAYPHSVIKDFFQMQEGALGWEKLLDRYHINGVITFDDPLANFTKNFFSRPGWQVVFQDGTAAVYIRQ